MMKEDATNPPVRRRTATPTGSGLRGRATDAAYAHLLQLASELGPDARIPPVRNLLQHLRVSRATLDAALTRLERNRIVLRRERSGIFVAPRRTARNVCLVCSPKFFFSGPVSPFWSLLLERAHALAGDSRIRLSTAFTDIMTGAEQGDDVTEDPSHLPDWLIADIESGKIDGVLAVGQSHGLARWIEARGTPVVAFAGAAQFIIGMGIRQRIERGVAALAAEGCRHIHFWKRPDRFWWPSYNQFQRETFAAAIARHDLSATIPSDNPLLPESGNPSHTELGWDIALRTFGTDADPALRPDGILSDDDMITQGGLMAFQRLGIRPGADVPVATHANKGSSALRAWHDSIYRLEYDLTELVEMMFETLDAMMDGGPDEAESRLTFAGPGEVAGEPLERYRLIQPHFIPPGADSG